MKLLRNTWMLELLMMTVPGMFEMSESTMARLAAFSICTSAEPSAKPGSTSTPLKLFCKLQEAHVPHFSDTPWPYFKAQVSKVSWPGILDLRYIWDLCMNTLMCRASSIPCKTAIPITWLRGCMSTSEAAVTAEAALGCRALSKRCLPAT